VVRRGGGAVLACGARPADAAWSRRYPVAISQYADVALAVNRHGDVAVAWSSPPTGGGLRARYHTTIHVSFGDAHGRVVRGAAAGGQGGAAAGGHRPGWRGAAELRGEASDGRLARPARGLRRAAGAAPSAAVTQRR
jgi:hypothetical protein